MRDRHLRLAASSLATALAAAGVGGCKTTSSSSGGENGAPIATRDMHLNAFVETVDDRTVRVSAKLDDGKLFGTEYSLTGGDGLSACVGLQCRALTRSFFEALTSARYGAELPYVAETSYTISLSRRVATAAPTSVVALPVLFTILSPGTGVSVTDGDTVTVQWSPAGTGATVNVDADALCEHEDGARTEITGMRVRDSDGDGSAAMAVDAILDDLDFFARTTSRVRRCDFTFEVVQERRGTVDANFAGGYVIGRVARAVTIGYRPTGP